MAGPSEGLAGVAEAHTEEEFRAAARSFADVGDALAVLLADAVRIIDMDPVFGGTAVHALDRVTALNDRAQGAAQDCSAQARVAEDLSLIHI